MSRVPLPARRLEIPEGFVVTNVEIKTAIEALNERVARGEPGFRIDVTKDAPEFYLIKVPVGATITREDAIVVLTLANRAIEARHADLLISVADGILVKRWLTLKDSRTRTGARFSETAPAVGGVRVREEF